MTLLKDVDVGGTKYAYATKIPMGTSATPAGSEVKDCAFADSFELNAGNLISVTFTYANTYGDGSTTYPKLLINGTQYPVKQPVGGYASSGAWANGQAVTFMFDGTNLVLATVPVVDTVAAGNMNSVTSNAVNSALTDFANSIRTAIFWQEEKTYTFSSGDESIILAIVTPGGRNALYFCKANYPGVNAGIKVYKICGEDFDYTIDNENNTLAFVDNATIVAILKMY